MIFIGKQSDKSELSSVCVLILVHHYILVNILIVIQYLGKILEKLDRVEDNIVKIHSVGKL